MPSSPPSGSAPGAAPSTPSAAPDEPRALRIEDWLTVLVMAALALITFANVLVRYFTNSSFAWTEEISIRIEYFAEGGSPLRRKRLAQLGATCVAVLFALIAVLSVRVVWDDYRFGETSPGIGVPQWWYSIWLPVLSTLIAARAVGVLVRRTRAEPEDASATGEGTQP